MSLLLQAPLPTLQTTLSLPNPQVDDVEARKHSIDIFRAIDGTKRTSVRANDRSLLTYNLTLDRIKAEGLKAFLRAYSRAQIRLRDHKNQTWEGFLTANPVEFAQAGRHRLSVQLQFEGSKVS